MNFFSTKKKPIYFITKSFKEELREKSDLVLSPEFYWVKKVKLNLKYTYEANKMVISVFDGILPQGDFAYRVFKMAKKEFLFIAYDMSDIIQKLEQLGIDMKKVDKIYTLQSEFINTDVVLRVDDEYAVASNEGIMTYTPLVLLDTMVEVRISDVINERKLSKNYIYSRSFQKAGISAREFVKIISLLVLLISVLLVEEFRVQNRRDLMDFQKANLVQKYNLPQTSFQIKSMRDELLGMNKKQSSLKKGIEYLGKFKLNKGESFSRLSYKKSLLKFIIKLNSKTREKYLKAYISKNYTLLKTERLKTGYMIEVGL